MTTDTKAIAAKRLRPVGFFDSGRGGESIRSAFLQLCPDEDTRYYADTMNLPYGNKTAGEVRLLSEIAARHLIEDEGCKMVVVACNTATAAAIDHLRATWPNVPFVGVEPAVKPAALNSKSGIVGVLATQGTFNGRLYRETKARFAKDVTVIATVADEFVRMVEEGRTQGVEAEETVRLRLEPLIAAGADQIVLGCTHFPHLKGLMEKVAAGRAKIIDPSEAVALQAQRVLGHLGLLAPRSVLVTGGTIRLGHAIAEACRAQCWRVITSSHRPGSGADIIADLSRDGGPERLIEEARRLLDGRTPAVVVNNAALYVGASEDATWRVNYFSPRRIAKLMEGRGRVINILDRHVERHQGTAYARAKFALAQWSRNAAPFVKGIEVGDVAELAPVGRSERALLAPDEERETIQHVCDRVVAAIAMPR